MLFQKHGLCGRTAFFLKEHVPQDLDRPIGPDRSGAKKASFLQSGRTPEKKHCVTWGNIIPCGSCKSKDI